MLKEHNHEDKIISIRENVYGIKEKVEGKTKIPYNDIIILVHGYNVSEKEAQKAYTNFQENFNKYCSQLSELNQSIYWFFWPSDKPSKLESVYSYFKTVNTAKICGKKFTSYLNKLNLISTKNKRPSLILIGHSLGCRLLLEAVKNNIKTNYKLEVFLMAAAVPVTMVEPGQELHPSLSSNEKYSILYSKKDRVLRWAFPPGQKLAGEEFNEAVGLKGQPNVVWNKSKETTYHHSDYWKGEESAEWIALRLGVLKTPSRRLKLKPLTMASEVRDLSWRKIPEREDPKVRSLI